MVPTPVFDTYWRFAAERQAIFHRRLSNPSGPWTNDPILRRFRFTNVYRVSDRISQYLIGEVQYPTDRSQEPPEIFFRTMLFKFFNKIETWETLEHRLGPLSWDGTNFNLIKTVLDELWDSGERIYSAAYIMPSPAFGHHRKHANHLALLARMMEDRLPERLRHAPSLRDVYERLLGYPGIGPFLAFQFAIDLNYSSIMDFDEDDLVVAGPGALDGIAKCFKSIEGKSPEDIIRWVADHQSREFSRLGLVFQYLFGRRLRPIDCQNLFCEISKYARVAHPEFVGRLGRTRIKQTYRPDDRSLPRLCFPPKWRIQLPVPTAS